jgi:hypothetical protein
MPTGAYPPRAPASALTSPAGVRRRPWNPILEARLLQDSLPLRPPEHRVPHRRAFLYSGGPCEVLCMRRIRWLHGLGDTVSACDASAARRRAWQRQPTTAPAAQRHMLPLADQRPRRSCRRVPGVVRHPPRVRTACTLATLRET